MTMTRRSFDSTPQPADLPIEFLVIGGGLTGLACAIALRRVGHQVTVLEKEDDMTRKSTHGLRIPPNLSRIFNHWGLREEVQQIARKMGTMKFLLQSTGELLGIHKWDEELLKEARGEFQFARYCDVHGLLYNIALKYGAKFRTGAHVTAVDPEGGKVTLASGEELTAHVLVGADGITGVTRQTVLSMQDDGVGSEDIKAPLALCMYSTAIAREQMEKEPGLVDLFDGDETPLYVWLGDSRMVYGFPIGHAQAFAMDVYGPPCDCEGRWKETVPPSELLKVLEPCEPRLRKLSKVANSLVSYPMADQPDLEDWIEGRLVLIGEAAHPIPVGPGSTQRCAMAVEDGAVLAKLFSHLRKEDQIDSFLWAFQDLRQPRCQSVSRQEVELLQYFTLDGEAQDERNKGMRSIRDAGGYLLDANKGGDQNLEWAETGWAELKELYGYDAEDEADNWWVEWGLLRERAKGSVDTQFNFGNIQVSEN